MAIETALDLVGMIPGVGALKAAREAGQLGKAADAGFATARGLRGFDRLGANVSALGDRFGQIGNTLSSGFWSFVAAGPAATSGARSFADPRQLWQAE